MQVAWAWKPPAFHQNGWDRKSGDFRYTHGYGKSRRIKCWHLNKPKPRTLPPTKARKP